MKIYTRTGDNGETGLFGGPRVRKDVLRVEAYGTADECNSAIGVARAVGVDPALDAALAVVQNHLFVVGADLASPEDSPYIPRVTAEMTAFLEAQIDAMEAELAPLKQFILPGGTAGAAYLHLARTICRRAERVVVSLAAKERINTELVPYLNRLSDFLFVAARIANARAGVADVAWQKP